MQYPDNTATRLTEKIMLELRFPNSAEFNRIYAYIHESISPICDAAEKAQSVFNAYHEDGGQFYGAGIGVAMEKLKTAIDQEK